MSLGVPSLFHEAVGHVCTVGRRRRPYRGHLLDVEDNMNCQLAEVTLTARDGRVAAEQVYIRGSKICFVVAGHLRTRPCSRRRAS